MEEQATKRDLQELASTILDAMNGMYNNLCNRIDEKIDRSENRMKAWIENGLAKQVQMNGERLDALTERMDRMEVRQGAMEEHMAHLTMRVESIVNHLASVERDVSELKQDTKAIRHTLDDHGKEIYILKKAK